MKAQADGLTGSVDYNPGVLMHACSAGPFSIRILAGAQQM
jgi:hypothetical protein